MRKIGLRITPSPSTSSSIAPTWRMNSSYQTTWAPLSSTVRSTTSDSATSHCRSWWRRISCRTGALLARATSEAGRRSSKCWSWLQTRVSSLWLRQWILARRHVQRRCREWTRTMSGIALRSQDMIRRSLIVSHRNQRQVQQVQYEKTNDLTSIDNREHLVFPRITHLCIVWHTECITCPRW